MIDGLPAYVTIIFILTAFAAVGFLLSAIRKTGIESVPSQIAVFVLPFWIFFTAIISLYGFYLKFDAVPPRILLFGAMPGFLLSIAFVVFFRKSLVDKLPLKTLTMLHIVRVPVELVLFWLFAAKLVPQAMTFEGHNFDIVSGISAPIIYFIAFRGGRTNRTLLLAWNVAALVLLMIIVGTAIAAFPSPLQKIAFDQPNVAVAYFPFIWLPAIVVPIVFFAHLASVVKLLRMPAAG